MSEAFGIMDSAYFVNKNDILKWINTTLKLQIEKIDSLGSGAVYCQLLDMIYPGSVCMPKVNWKAKLEYEYLSNFKIVTTCLEKNDVKKHVDVNKLVKCRYQDNLEFAQWFKKFFDLKGGDRSTEYDAEGRRSVKVTGNNGNDMPKPARKEQQRQLKNAATVAAATAENTETAKTDNTAATTKPAAQTATDVVGTSQPSVVADSTKIVTPAATPASATSKVVHSTIPSHSVVKKTATSGANTSSNTSKPSTVTAGASKPSTATAGTSKPSTATAGTSLNNKRTFSQMQGQSQTKGKTPVGQVKSTASTAVSSNTNKDFNLLISALSEILNSGQNDTSIVTKIKQLVKDNGSNNASQQAHNPAPAEGNGKETIVTETPAASAVIAQASAEQQQQQQQSAGTSENTTNATAMDQESS